MSALKPTPRWFWKAAVTFGTATTLFLGWVVLRVGGAQITDAVDDLGELVAALVAAGSCTFAAHRLPKHRWAWALLAASSTAWAAGEAVWTYYDLGRGVEVPFPSLADVGFLVAVPLAAGGLILFAGPAMSPVSRFRGVLDVVFITGSLLFVSWITVLDTVAQAPASGLFTRCVSLSYPVGDVALASLVVILFTRARTRTRISLALVMAGTLAFAVSDSSFAYLSSTDSYGLGNALDTGWVAGYLLIALGALWAVAHSITETTTSRRATIGTALGPYLPLGAASAAFLWRTGSHAPLGMSAQLAAFGLVVVLSVRQILVLADNLTLTTELEVRIEQRTAELQHRAFHDGLTGLANRALFNEYLRNAVQRRARTGTTISVLFIDLDGFKQVNDLYGHALGDQVLRAVAARFREAVREADTVARLGADEFAVLLENDRLASDPSVVADRVLASLEQTFRVSSTRVAIQASIGIATDGVGCDSAEELLRNADLAMYSAKARGRHGWELYLPEMHLAMLERMRIEAELRSALQHDEFVLHYQPIIDLATDTVKEVEALIRWNHPRRGLVSPADFIPAAEATGMIVELGEWVLRQACQEVQGWPTPAQYPPVGLCVNLSAVQLSDGSVVDTVAAALAETGLEPSRLTLEITESVIMEDLGRAIDALRRLRAIGVRIAIDDFGTGYSSLSALRELPVDTLKIDRSFVMGITSDKSSADLARRILQLAADFRLHTVAEGVEQGDQVRFLRTLGCESIQGFFFSRPLPSDEIPVLLARGRDAFGRAGV